MQNEWIEEEISPEQSILYKRVYRNADILLGHIRKVSEGKNGAVIVFKFEGHYPNLDNVKEFLSCSGFIIGKIPTIKSARVVRLLYGDWFIELVVSLSVGIAAGVIANKITSRWNEKYRKRRGHEEIIEMEEYYPNGKIKRRYKRFRKWK